MPNVLSGNDRRLKDVTGQPLLNWLLAQILTLDGAEKAETVAGVHDLYSRLFDHVLSRVHREARSEASDAVDRNRLERMLEEAAVAVWHKGERTVPLPRVMERLQKVGLDADLDRVTKNRESALTTLLDSFFCRAHSGVEHKVVEFTHKSFAEFLTARRIVREMGTAHTRISAFGDDASIREAVLREWLALCGPAAMDVDLLAMVRAEVAAPPCREQRGRDMAGWRRTFTTLFQESITFGMPLPNEPRARAAERLVHNAEVSLLAALNAVVLKMSYDGDQSKVILNWSGTSAGDLLHRLIGTPQNPTIARIALSHFDLSRTDLFRANLNDTDLSWANLNGADLNGADLSRACLKHANLSYAHLIGAVLSRADLSNATLKGAKLNSAKLFGADINNTEVTGTDFENASGLPPDLLGKSKPNPRKRR